MKKIIRFKVLLFSILILFSSCSDDFLFDFLLGPQPNFIHNNEFTPGLNILGIIRPDSLNSKPLSYILVEKLIPAVSSVPDSFNIIDAKVMVYKIENGISVDSFEFVFDSTHFFPSIYRPQNFVPEPGDLFKIKCFKDGFPEVTAETTVPEIPIIENNTVSISGNKVQLSIISHPTAAMYDVYLFSGDYTNSVRVPKVVSGNTTVEVSFTENLHPEAYIIIYIYDKNLAAFLTAPNIFIKPNTYRPPFTSVTGGYGCFGSMNLLVIDL